MATTTIGAGTLTAIPWQKLEGSDGVRYKVMWRDPRGDSYAGALRIDPGCSLGRHMHRTASHHVWVVVGSCLVDGRELDHGSYAFVPPGEEHGLTAGSEGCTLFYLYLKPDQA